MTHKKEKSHKKNFQIFKIYFFVTMIDRRQKYFNRYKLIQRNQNIDQFGLPHLKTITNEKD